MSEKLNLTEVQKKFLAKLSMKAIELEKENASLKRSYENYREKFGVLLKGIASLERSYENYREKFGVLLKENAELKRQLQDLNAQYEEYYSNKSERIILALSNENKALKERLKNLELQINRKIIPTSI